MGGLAAAIALGPAKSCHARTERYLDAAVKCNPCPKDPAAVLYIYQCTGIAIKDWRIRISESPASL